LAVALVAGALLACSYDDGTTVDDQQLREDVVYCEEAVAHLEMCCDGFVAEELACKHSVTTKEPSCDATGGYSNDKEDPALDLAESRCILATDCDLLVRQGVCGRAQAARAQRSGTSYYEEEGEPQGTAKTYSTPHAKVCP
jgi:hypothetical protein